MQITRETDYAIRCVYYLADKMHRVTMVEEIAREMSIPRSFLAKIVQKLSKAGLIQSYRGVKGGFQLTRKPEEITILDVIEAVEGPVVMNVCAFDRKLCDRSDSCPVHPVWVEVRGAVEDVLRMKTFDQLKSP